MGQRFTIHVNTRLEHQVRIGRALYKGLRRHGNHAVLTNAPDTHGDIHVVLGPWFCGRRYESALYIDRAYWGDPDCVSIHWMAGGEKRFTKNETPRAHPEPEPYRSLGGTIYLCDYNQAPPREYAHFRQHPAQVKGAPLREALSGFSEAHGKRTTALVDAAIWGLKVITDDKFSPVYEISGRTSGRDRWLNHLAWHNWSLKEIENGDFLDGIGHSHTL